MKELRTPGSEPLGLWGGDPGARSRGAAFAEEAGGNACGGSLVLQGELWGWGWRWGWGGDGGGQMAEGPGLEERGPHSCT